MSAQADLLGQRRIRTGKVGATYPTEFPGGRVRVVSYNPATDRYTGESGLTWQLVDGVMVTPEECKPVTPLRIRGEGAAIAVRTCPTCGAVLNAQAIVTDFMQPATWAFWGEQGSRWKRCHGTYELADGRLVRYQHFVVTVNGRKVDRLAWIAGEDNVCYTGDDHERQPPHPRNPRT